MKIGQIARLAGVTVRTVRHYHQIEVLPEPARAANGYREYGTGDLLRLIRIRRATTAGIPLDRVAGVLDRSGHASTAALLMELEDDLNARIDTLVAQRALVRRMAQGEFDPSIPPELRATHEQSLRWGMSSGVHRFDVNHAELLVQLVGSSLTTYLNETTDLLRGSSDAVKIQGISSRFGQADSSTSPRELTRLIEDSIEFLRPIIEQVGSVSIPSSMSAEARSLIEEHRRVELNATQRHIIEHIVTALRALPPANA